MRYYSIKYIVPAGAYELTVSTEAPGLVSRPPLSGAALEQFTLAIGEVLAR